MQNWKGEVHDGDYTCDGGAGRGGAEQAGLTGACRRPWRAAGDGQGYPLVDRLRLAWFFVAARTAERRPSVVPRDAVAGLQRRDSRHYFLDE